MELGIHVSGSPMNPVVDLSFDRRGMVVDFSGSHRWSADELEVVVGILRSQSWVRKVVEHKEGGELQ
jgi:hypothetical protein